MEQRSTPGAALPGLPGDVFDEALTARVVVDERGIMTGWSEGARRLLGYRPDEIVGRPAGLLDGDASPQMLRGIRAAPRWNGRVTLRHRNGGRVEAGVIAHHRTQRDTAPDWLLVSPLDGAARPEDDKLAAWCFQQSPSCAMWTFDTHLRHRGVNHYAELIGNLTGADHRGLRVTAIWVRPGMDRLEQSMLRALQTGEPRHLELYLQVPATAARALSTCWFGDWLRVCRGVVGPVSASGSGRDGHGCGAGDLVPGGEAVVHFGAVFGGGEQVASGPEVRRDLAEGGEELLGGAR
jgi:PAS domain S-box-containing protein